MRKVKILITGGAGFIGSHVNQLLQKEGYETVVLDDLSRGNPKAVIGGTFIKGSVERDLNQIFSNHQIEAVIHLAASIQVGESVKDPLAFYRNNVQNTLILLEEMQKAGVSSLIFSSSAAIFGRPTTPLIAEDHPKKPMNPYGRTKLIIEEILEDCDAAYGLRSSALRYFNAAGGDPEGKIKYKSEQNLIPIILNSLKGGTFTLFGRDYDTPDGTCIRDYIHVLDLARAHLYTLRQLLDGSPSSRYNLGNGMGYSVQEVIDMVEKVTGIQVPLEEGPRRAGDPARLVANAELAKKGLGWSPEYALPAIVDHAWRSIV